MLTATSTDITVNIAVDITCTVNMIQQAFNEDVMLTKMRRNPNYFNSNKHVKICSELFKSEDFIIFAAAFSPKALLPPQGFGLWPKPEEAL